MWGLEPDEALQARVLMQELLDAQLMDHAPMTPEQFSQFEFSSLGTYFSGIADHFSSAEIEELFKAHKDGTLTTEAFDTALKVKHLPSIPTSFDELNQAILALAA